MNLCDKGDQRDVIVIVLLACRPGNALLLREKRKNEIHTLYNFPQRRHSSECHAEKKWYNSHRSLIILMVKVFGNGIGGNPKNILQRFYRVRDT